MKVRLKLNLIIIFKSAIIYKFNKKMKNKYFGYLILFILIIGLVTIFLFSFRNKDKTVVVKDKLYVQTGWIINGEFANVCSAIVQGYYNQENLDVKLIPGGPSGANFIVATTTVAQDKNLDIGIEGDLVPLLKGVTKENENERLKMKAFASFWNENPFGFMVKDSSGISSIKDFSKRKANGSKIKIGVTADFVLQSALAKYIGIDEKDLNFITVGFDATPLILGQVDALAGYWTTQAYELEKANIGYKFLSIGELPGFNQPSMIAVASDNTLKNKKPQLERWLKATIKGSQFVRDNPELAAKDILDTRCGGPSLNLDQETWLIKKSVPLFGTDKVGNLNLEMIGNFAKAYQNLGQIPSVPDFNSYIDTSILESLSSK